MDRVWATSDPGERPWEKHSPERGPPPMARAVPESGVVSFMGWVISQANKWEDHSSYLEEGAPPTFGLYDPSALRVCRLSDVFQ